MFPYSYSVVTPGCHSAVAQADHVSIGRYMRAVVAVYMKQKESMTCTHKSATPLVAKAVSMAQRFCLRVPLLTATLNHDRTRANTAVSMMALQRPILWWCVTTLLLYKNLLIGSFRLKPSHFHFSGFYVKRENYPLLHYSHIVNFCLLFHINSRGKAKSQPATRAF